MANGKRIQAGVTKKSDSQKLVYSGVCTGGGAEGERAQRAHRPGRGPPEARMFTEHLLRAPDHTRAFLRDLGEPEEPQLPGEGSRAVEQQGRQWGSRGPPLPLFPAAQAASKLTFPWLSMPTRASEVQDSCMALKWTAGPVARERLTAGSSAERGAAEL